MRSPCTGRREPRWNALTCTNARSPPPLGTTKPNPLSSFQSVIRPANRIVVSINAPLSIIFVNPARHRRRSAAYSIRRRTPAFCPTYAPARQCEAAARLHAPLPQRNRTPMSDTPQPHNPKIIYTLTDQAAFLATQSLLPIVEAFVESAGVQVETRDIS